MSLDVIVGFEPARLSLSATFSDGGGANALSWSTGQYAHIDLSSAGVSHTEWAAQLQSSLNAVMSETFTVTYSVTNRQYTIAATGAFTTTAQSTDFAALMGLSGLITSTTSKVSDVNVFYARPVVAGALSDMSGPEEPGGVAEEADAGASTHYGLADADVPELRRFTISHEAKAVALKDEALAADPWTWEHLIEHARNVEPIATYDGTTTITYYQLADSASKRGWLQRAVPNYDEWWSLQFSTRRKGKDP